MGLKSKKRILVAEDQNSWQRLIEELIEEVASELDCVIEVVIASRFVEVLNSIVTVPYDCITVDNKLVDGTMAKTLLDRIAGLDHKVPVIVISGAVDPSDVRDFFKEYDIYEFFWKRNFDPKKFKQALVELLAPVQQANEQQELRQKQIGGKRVDWNSIISAAVSVVSPYANAFALGTATAAATKLGEALFESVKGLWGRIREMLHGSNDELANQVWERFKEDPQNNKTDLVEVIRRLSPDDDPVMRAYVQGLINELELRHRANLYLLLDNRSYYTFNDLKRICSRVSPQWEDDLGSNPTREKLARWVVNYAPTRDRQQDLIAAMLEVNPAMMMQ